MLDVDQFVSECQASLLEAEPRLAVSDLLERTLADASSVERALPATRGELTKLHHSPDLTVLKVVWAPGMSIWPHDHQMWAAIGIYAGQEDNTFFRRVDGCLEARRTRELATNDVVLLGAAALPIDRLRGPGRAILHGEQAFEYERWPKVGDILEGRTVISDVYEKERSNGGKLEFYVTETDWKDATSGEPVVKSIFTLVINVRPQS